MNEPTIETAESRRASLWRRRLDMEEAMLLLRRRFGGESPRQRLIAGGVTWAARLAGLYERGRANARAIRLAQVEIRAPLWPRELDGFRILHLGDCHFDGDPGAPARMAAVLDGVSVDVCAYTGDTLYYPETDPGVAAAHFAAMIAPVRSRYGFFGVMGNNDFSWLRPLLAERGLRWLVNEHAAVGEEVSPVVLAGVDDPHKFRCADLGAALAGAPSGCPVVVLAHSPDIAAEAAGRGAALTLCGHTHGGQLCLPGGYPIYRNGRFPRDRTRGAWRLGSMAGYTVSGLGCTAVPLRFHCAPEAALLTVRRMGD